MNIAQRALLTHRGRVVLAIIYILAAIVSIVVYTIMRSPGYGIGQFVVLGFGLVWVIWCVRRP